MKEMKDAVDMLSRSITAIDHLSPALEFVVLQTGAKVRFLQISSLRADC
jgi:hypothetical protein